MSNIWTTKDGKEIRIEDMETSHIENSIKMLERNAEKGGEIVYGYGYAGDDDFPTAEVEFVMGEAYLKHTQHFELTEELKKRNKK